ncbi:hypothetical protein LJC60_00490 [Ruminococcaceae bacterium OttesenSCG-928-D13]|nr:hypothetical protein [Ruminococcaceae bacterium OttesenSCG-928-D13]
MAFEPKLKYKGKPLVRSKNEMYYGDFSDPWVVFMQILSTKQENGDELPDKVMVMLLSTDTTLAPKDRIAKQSVKNGLYNALDFAAILLERALADEKKVAKA